MSRRVVERPGRESWRNKAGLSLGLVLSGMLGGGCLFDGDDRCGEGQILVDDYCQCPEGSALVGQTCIECGEDEVPGDGGCVAAIEGLGQTCANSSECFPSGADTCAADEAESYCSIECGTSSDCPFAFACDVDAETPACLIGPSGFGEACESSDDCAGFEAGYCETLQEKACMVECQDDPSVCPGDWSCCDFTGLIGKALCIPPDNLEGGSCPLGADMLEARK